MLFKGGLPAEEKRSTDSGGGHSVAVKGGAHQTKGDVKDELAPQLSA